MKYKVRVVFEGEVEVDLSSSEVERELKSILVTDPQLLAVSKLTQNYFDDTLQKYYSQHHSILKNLDHEILVIPEGPF